MQVSTGDLKPAGTLNEILKINIAEERAAISGYTKILEGVESTNVILYQTIREIIRDEQEHLEELETLQSPK
jgi:rubrerythrin